jgi:hypothetical protein
MGVSKRSVTDVLPLDGVGGWVFTRHIEHTFENMVILMMREVLL